MIAKLESDVGLRLVDRDRRRVSLTADGERLIASARRMIAELDEIGADLRDRATMGKGRVVVATSSPFVAHWLPPLIAQFRAKYPGIRLELFVRGIAVEDAMEVEQLPTVAGLVAAGLGVSVVPSIAVPFFDHAKVALVPVVSPGLDRPIHLVWQTARVLAPAAQAFVETLEGSLPKGRRR